MKKPVGATIKKFGRIDVLINNAGILRDKSFIKMEPDNWKAVMDVHLSGAYNVTRPAFSAMKENGFGRIVMTTSAAGLYGNFGQTNYSAAKMALVGLMNTLRLEGKKYDIKVNTVAPLAASRLTEDVMPPELFEKSKPEFVSPMVLYLCSEECRESGAIFNSGMGYYNRAAIMTGPGIKLGEAGNPPTPEQISENWDKINLMEGAKEIEDANSAVFALVAPPDTDKKETGAQKSAGPDVKSIFGKMTEVFNAEAAKDVDAVFQYIISGSEGGNWFVTVKDSKCAVTEGTAEKSTCTLIISDGDFVELITGKLNPMQAFTSGKLKIEGDIMKSQLIGKLFKLN